MSKRRLAAAAMALAVVLTGCSAAFDREWSSSRQHEDLGSQDPADAEMTLEAGDYGSFYEAVRTFIASGVERGAVRMASYSGDMDADIAQAVFTASNETPEGAYCVYYINYNITRLVSVYEVSISIIYRHSPEELGTIVRCQSQGDMEAMMLSALRGRMDSVTVWARDEELDETGIRDAIEKAYYENPGEILYIPSYSVSSYPQEGSERIMEIALSYPYATSTVEARARQLDRRVEEILPELGQGPASDRLTKMGGLFTRSITFDESVNSSDVDARRYNAMTAYGALVQGSAVAEGYAMAVKVLCDRMGVECVVVRGRYNNMDHAWDIVRLENGQLYHVDLCAFDPAGAVFKTDRQQLYANYWWDSGAYPACAGQSLYGPEYDPSVVVDPNPPVGS